MTGWTTHEGTAVVLPLADIDTDQIIPARFMSTPRSQGYGGYLLHDLRRDGGGAPRVDFPLEACPGADVLVAGPNFGSGSSREAAVYALVDAGFRAVLAPGFGDIFAGNAVNNGLLPARIDADLYAALAALPSACAPPVRIDLEVMRLVIGDRTASFALDESWRVKLINGWDDIDLTRQHRGRIDAFRDHRRWAAPWAWPAAAD